MAKRARILINALKLHRGASRSPTGNFQHVYHLSKALIQTGGFDYKILCDLDSYEAFSEFASSGDLILEKFSGESVAKSDLAVIKAVRRLKPAVYHRPTGQLPFFPLKCLTVAGIADLNYTVLPTTFIKRLYKEISYRWTVFVADWISCVSEFTRSDVIKRLGADPKKVSVVLHGSTKLADPGGLGDLRVPDRFWLLFGHEPHKNVELAVRAIKENASLGSLVVVGANTYIENIVKPLAMQLGVGCKVVFVGRVPSAILASLYRNAVGLIFVSRYEGFGLPILEAMSVGCPVISSRVCSLPEVGGSAAKYIDPDDLLGLVSEMNALINNREHWNTCSRLGIERSHQFSWDKAALETNQIYANLLSQRIFSEA